VPLRSPTTAILTPIGGVLACSTFPLPSSGRAPAA